MTQHEIYAKQARISDKLQKLDELPEWTPEQRRRVEDLEQDYAELDAMKL